MKEGGGHAPCCGHAKAPSLVKCDSKKGGDALFHACSCGNDFLVESLLDEGVNINEVNEAGETPLCVACRHHCSKKVDSLPQNGANVDKGINCGRKPLCVTSRLGGKNTVKMSLQHGADANQMEGNVACSHMAGCRGHENTVELLIPKSHANINAVSKCGETSLCIASQHGQGKVLDVLLQNVADVDQPTNAGETSLWISVF